MRIGLLGIWREKFRIEPITPYSGLRVWINRRTVHSLNHLTYIVACGSIISRQLRGLIKPSNDTMFDLGSRLPMTFQRVTRRSFLVWQVSCDSPEQLLPLAPLPAAVCGFELPPWEKQFLFWCLRMQVWWDHISGVAVWCWPMVNTLQDAKDSIS